MKDLDQIYSFLKKLETLSFEEINIAADDLKIYVKRNKDICCVETKEENFKKGSVDENFVVRAPLSGTVYLNSNADEVNFVQKGEEIKMGQILCLIETRNIFNEIKSGEHGFVAEVLVENESQVDQGQALFVIKKFSL